MKMVLFSVRSYDRDSFEEANRSFDHELIYVEARLDRATASLAEGSPAICAFVNDRLDGETIRALARGGTRLIALRCAGFNNVDLKEAQAQGVTVARVPSYSPHAIAEHTVGLILTLDRKIHRANNRVRDGNFALDGLLGFDLHGKTVGIVGTGKIGAIVARIMHGFGCRVIAVDGIESPECLKLGVEYVALSELLAKSDIVTLHCPLTKETRHLIDENALAKVKPGMMLINTSRGAVIDTKAVVKALKTGRIGNLGLDVYEEEADVFFEDGSDHALRDDILARLLTFPNVLITGHQGFFTKEAMSQIAETTLGNLSAFERGVAGGNEVVRVHDQATA